MSLLEVNFYQKQSFYLSQGKGKTTYALSSSDSTCKITLGLFVVVVVNSCLLFSELGRLAGVAFVVPIVNYQWPSLPESVLKDDERKRWYKRMTWVARYAPKLLHWWMIRKTSQSSSTDSPKPTYFTDKDLELLKNAPGFQFLTADKLKSRSVFNNLRSDFLVAFSKWDFDPLELSNPFPENDKRSVHLWHGCEDRFINLKLQRHVSERLPWIQYHEVRDGGHLLIYDTAVCEAILKSLLLGEDTPLYIPKFSS